MTTINIALDIGYGDVKCKIKDKIFKFDSAVCYAKNTYTELGNHPTYEFEGKRYLVGKEAVSEAFTTRDYAFLEKYAPLFIYKALELANIPNIKPNKNKKDDLQINLITGLSLVDWKTKKKQFADRIKSFYINGNEINLNVILVPQGQGIFTYYAKKHPEVHNQKVIIDDIGYNTQDRLVFDNGVPNPLESYATNTGANRIVTEIQTILSSEYQMDFPEQEIKHFLINKNFTIGGQKKDISNLINSEVEKYFEFYMNESRGKKKALMSRADKIIIAGGTAYYLENLSFPENVTFMKNEKHEFLNVYGYWEELMKPSAEELNHETV